MHLDTSVSRFYLYSKSPQALVAQTTNFPPCSSSIKHPVKHQNVTAVSFQTSLKNFFF